MLKSQLFLRAKDLVKKVPDSVIESDDGAVAIVKAVYKRDALSTVTDVYHDFMNLLNLKRGQNESFKNFESRFEATVSKFNSHSDSSKIPESLTALMLLANSNVDSGQRISVLAAVSPTADTENATTDDFLKAISYESVASVLRQCDRAKQGDMPSSPSVLNANSSSATTGGHDNRRKKGKKTLNPEQLADLKSKTRCHTCRKKGHWSSEHNADGSLKPGAVVIEDTPATETPASDTRRRSVTFNMVNMHRPDEKLLNNFIGPLLDDGAPYSGMGFDDFKILQSLILPDCNGKLEPLPDSIADRPYWQYGAGKHASAPRKILGSVLLSIMSDGDHAVYIRHLIISGTSQWVVGRNVTRACDIRHIGANKLVLPDTSGTSACDSISIVDHDLHSYLPYSRFLPPYVSASLISTKSHIFCATAQLGDDSTSRSWIETQKIVDKVHRHVCGHSNYSDMKLLLQRNDLWNAEIQNISVVCLKAVPNAPRPLNPNRLEKSA